MKDAASVLGYLAHATDRVGLGTSISHFGTRHPMVQASWGATMQVLSGGRFTMGFGRSSNDRWQAWGVPAPTTASMGDYADILRRLWAHEKVSYDGPAGSFRRLHLGEFPDFEPPALLLAAIGPNSLALVGRSFDGVLLHPFTSLRGVAAARATVRQAAEHAGRDPDGVRIVAQVVTAPDLADQEIDHVVRARIASYLFHRGFGELIVDANGWDMGPVEAFRAAAHEATGGDRAPGATPSGRARLVEPSRILPEQWLSESAAIGTAAECATILHRFLDAGADEIVVHGTTADRLGPTVEAFLTARP
jgi:probable F420-dependent oxidoreductase